jgi:hypothetical protein
MGASVASTDSTITIVHNNEFIGSGITLYWVCAAKVTDLVEMAWTRSGQPDGADLSPPDLSTPVLRSFAVRATGLTSEAEADSAVPKFDTLPRDPFRLGCW